MHIPAHCTRTPNCTLPSPHSPPLSSSQHHLPPSLRAQPFPSSVSFGLLLRASAGVNFAFENGKQLFERDSEDGISAFKSCAEDFSGFFLAPAFFCIVANTQHPPLCGCFFLSRGFDLGHNILGGEEGQPSIQTAFLLQPQRIQQGEGERVARIFWGVESYWQEQRAWRRRKADEEDEEEERQRGDPTR